MTRRTGTTILAFLLVAMLGLVEACKKKAPTTTAGAKPTSEEPGRPPETRVSPPPSNVPP